MFDLSANTPRRILRGSLFSAAALLLLPHAGAQAFSRFGDHVFFAGSPSAGYYPYSSGSISAPSTVRLIDGKVPLETDNAKNGGNALELAWTSAPNGGWDVQSTLR